MMNVTLLCVGRLREEYFSAACKEYEKRLKGFCRFETVIIEPERLSAEPSEKEILSALKKEGEELLRKIPAGAFVTALCVEGKQLGSERLAKLLDELPSRGYGNVAFIIGSSFGLSEEVKNAAQLRLSMSEMTFPHQLARVMLTEQLYRSFAIINNRKYHK